MPVILLIRTAFFIFFLSLPGVLNAQTFRYSQYTTNEGLPIDNVYAAAQDSMGFIWFGTDFGITRFDGSRFTNYSHQNGIATNAITDIVYAGGDSMLFLSYRNTIQSIHHDGKIKTIVPQTKLSLQQLLRHNNQFIYYSRGGADFGILENGKANEISADSLFHLKGVIIHCIFSAGDMGLVFCTNKGLFVKNGEFISHPLNNQDIQWGMYSLRKKLLIVSGNTVLESGQNLDFKKMSFLLPGGLRVYHMCEEKNGDIWLRGLDKGVYRIANSKLQDMSVRLKLENKQINEFFEDRDGNFWLCTDGAGILLKRKSLFVTYETGDGLTNNKVLHLFKKDKNLFVGTANGLSVLENNKLKTIEMPFTSTGLKYVHSIFEVNDKLTGLCMEAGIKFSTDKHKTSSSFLDFNYGPYAFRAFNSLFAWQQNEQNSWMMNALMLMHINEKNNSELFNLNVFQIRKGYCMLDYQDKLWMGTSNGIVFIEHNKITHLDTLNGKKLGQVFKFLIDIHHRLWIATDLGLYYYEGKTYSEVPKGKTEGSNYCLDITMDDAGKIWTATWDGIFVTDGRTKTYFKTNDGLASKTVNAVLYDTATKCLYAGTDNGLSILKKEDFNRIKPNYVLYATCKISGADSGNVQVTENSTLAATQQNLSFYLNTPYFKGNDPITFEYRLDNKAWVSSENPEILIRNIGSGAHAFYARAQVNGLPLSSKDLDFNFTIKKHYYETWWFWTIIVVIVQLLLFWLIYKINKKAGEKKLTVRMQQAEYASLKQQAFTSLMNPHFIFNALNSVQHYINKQDRQSANKYLSDFATLIRKSFDAAQKSFVGLEEELDTIRLYLQLEKMRFSDKFEYQIQLSKEAAEEDWMLPSMMLQPFLENAILHGLMPINEKGQLHIDITASNNILYITITDNGIGIEKSKALRSNSSHKSRGMQLIKERLELLSKISKEPIQLTITDLVPGATNPGTKISIVIPQEVVEIFQQQRAQG